ncbi:putative receptor-like protein kinase At5g59700 [Bidens hawaiensis]|uniref:putative receptor-like protein kinase At5g59700 n=1 Tax=Bidens hawaiensis TaxID=980011 RepID=UPI00404B25F2
MITNDVVQEELDKIIDPHLRKQIDTASLRRFIDLAHKCLKQQLMQRPTMDRIMKELEEVLELHANPMDYLEVPLSEMKRVTNDFNETYSLGSGGFGKVYRAKLDVLNVQSLSSMEAKCKEELPKISATVAIKRIINGADELSKQGFLTEIQLLSRCKHPNVVSLLGFSKEKDELIVVYEYASKGSLGDYLKGNGKILNLTWAQRLQIFLDTAKGINYLHTDMEGKPRIIHRDIKSDNILLDKNLNAKVGDFGLSRIHPVKQQTSTIYADSVVGTETYVDPEYWNTFKYKKETDIYSFGVVLFEVLSGRLA